jgi:uncharacterized protein
MGQDLITGMPFMAFDSFVNFVSRVGTSADKSTHAYYGMTMMDLFDLEAAYRQTWFRKICDIPPFDEVREWRAWVGADEKQITAIEELEKRHGLRHKVAEARTLARKDGGAALVIGVKGGAPSTELKPEEVGQDALQYIVVCNRQMIQPGEREDDPASPWFGQPKVWRMPRNNVEVHPSRVIRFTGNPIRIADYWDGWQGESIWVELRKRVMNSDQIAASIAALVDEAKVDVIRIDGLMSQITSTEYQAALVARWGQMGTFKSLVNALLLDKKDEYDQKTLTFAGLPDLQEKAMILMAGAADIPATRLFGRSAEGMNATGEGDMRNYYDRITAGQALYLEPALRPVDEILIRSALGSRPPEIWYEWNPLYTLTEKEAAEVEKLFAEAVSTYARDATLPPSAIEAIARAGIIERGQFPGAEKAFDEADAEGDEAGITAEPSEADLAEEEARAAIAKATARDPAGMAGPKPRLVASKDAQVTDAAPRTLYVRRDVVNAAAIKKWAKAQGFASVVDDMHVTIAHSGTPVDWMKVGTSWSGKLELPEGGPRLVERLGPKAIVLLFTADELRWRHEAVLSAGGSYDFDEYQPHITLTYDLGGVDLAKVVPYQGKIVLGPEIFEEVQAAHTIEHPES